MLAELIKGMISSSVPTPSPISQLMSIEGPSETLRGKACEDSFVLEIFDFLLFMKELLKFEFTSILQLQQMLILLNKQVLCPRLIGLTKIDLITRLLLCKQRQMSRNNVSYSRIAACGLMVSHQYDKLTVW